MGTSFFNEIIYSSSNEDSESERRALRIRPDDVVLCITGSGARSLDLLVDSPKKIISIDFNASQNHLLELKIAAFKELSYDDMISFIGIKESTTRLDVFQRLAPHLSEEAHSFWQKNHRLIDNGVLYCGKWERILMTLLRLSSMRSRTITRLIHSSTIKEQRSIWNTEWDNLTWKLFLKCISSRFLWVYLVREPGAKLIPKTFDVYSYMKSRFDHLANHFLIAQNHYANLLFNGRYLDTCELPHHLREEHFETVKRQVNNIEIVTGSLTEFLSTKHNEINAFSLSDFSSYAPSDYYDETWRMVIKAATDGAAFCERFFLVRKHP
jgi:S-adenosylmethionine-diacylglycerol 3-amino-3-carboxypropyl transferase